MDNDDGTGFVQYRTGTRLRKLVELVILGWDDEQKMYIAKPSYADEDTYILVSPDTLIGWEMDADA
jgi:hypothetical protein